jgi:hypothetical protein
MLCLLTEGVDGVVIACRGHHHHGKGKTARTITPSHSSALRAVRRRGWSELRRGWVEDEFMGISFEKLTGLMWCAVKAARFARASRQGSTLV